MERTKPNETWYLLVAASEAGEIMKDWLHSNQECNMRLHRSKEHRSCRVIELKDYVYAESLRRRFNILKVSRKRNE